MAMDHKEQNKAKVKVAYNMILNGYGLGFRDGDEIPFLRIFRSQTPKDLWNSYCSTLGVKESPKQVESIKIYFVKTEAELEHQDETNKNTTK